jgi:radical SAM protein with 4Fe4S-binding SPASM domain
MCSHPTSGRKPEIMSIDQFKTILDKLKNTKIRQLFLNMGEPFMDKTIFRKIAYAKRKGFLIYISTNGLLLTEESMNNILKTGVDGIKFSIEGYTPEVFNTIRVGGSFDRLFRNVVRMKELRDRVGSRMPIRISTILLKENEDIVEFVKFWGPYCDEIEYTTVTNHIGLIDNRDISLSPQWKHRKSCSQIKPYTEINVLSNGDVVICCVDFHARCVLGNLVEQEFEDIWFSDKMTEIRRKAYSDDTEDLDPCRDCFISDYSGVKWKNMRTEVSLIHDVVKNKMWDMLANIKYIEHGDPCAGCGNNMKISFAGFCLSCLKKRTGMQ